MNIEPMKIVSEQLARVGKRYRKECNGVCNPVEYSFVTDLNNCECMANKSNLTRIEDEPGNRP